MLKYMKQLYLPTDFVSTKFYPGLNGAKGLLILLVVFTHCLPPGMILYFLYFFHMPLFMSISGFLLKSTVFQNGYKTYITRMWRRLILPWLIASIIFIPFKLTESTGAKLQFTDIIYPYYHLWYIPSYLIGATICYCIIRFKIPVWPVILFTAIITIIWYNVYRDKHVPDSVLPLFWLGDKRIFAYLFFFVFGFSLRNKLVYIKLFPIYILIIEMAAFVLLAFGVFKKISSLYIVWPYMLFNTCLVIYVLMYMAPKNLLQHKLLLLINEQSLGIYLYHPLILTGAYILLNDRLQQHINTLQATGLFVIVMAITMALVWLLKKWSFTNMYVLGNKEKGKILQVKT